MEKVGCTLGYVGSWFRIHCHTVGWKLLKICCYPGGNQYMALKYIQFFGGSKSLGDPKSHDAHSQDEYGTPKNKRNRNSFWCQWHCDNRRVVDLIIIPRIFLLPYRHQKKGRIPIEHVDDFPADWSKSIESQTFLGLLPIKRGWVPAGKLPYQ